MNDAGSGAKVGIGRLILIPSLIALAMTIFRLIGEWQHWSEKWFNIPQLVFWGGFTILAGMLTGSIAAAIFSKKNKASTEGVFGAAG